MALEVLILESTQPPKYQQITEMVSRLRRLKLSSAAIGRMLGVNDKTVAKSIKFMTEFDPS